MKNAEPLTYDRLVKARAFMARVIQHHGEEYWPQFEHLDAACRSYTDRAERLQAALDALPLVASDRRDQVVRERQSDLQ
ncbi:MAG: hypothetical protein AAGI03_01420 [Pseudomonadota bacterium]